MNLSGVFLKKWGFESGCAGIAPFLPKIGWSNIPLD